MKKIHVLVTHSLGELDVILPIFLELYNSKEIKIKIMKHFKFLRGTSFDVFGMSTHRKIERGLISEYESMFTEIESNINIENYDAAVKIALLPDHIKGYDVVKESNIEKEILSILSPNLYFNMSCASLAKTTPLSLFVGRPIISELVKFPNLIHAPAKQTTIAMISNSQRKDFLYFSYFCFY